MVRPLHSSGFELATVRAVSGSFEVSIAGFVASGCDITYSNDSILLNDKESSQGHSIISLLKSILQNDV